VNLLWLMLFAVTGLASGGHGQVRPGASVTLAWTQGKCVRCTFAGQFGRIQFASRIAAWAVGYSFPPP
jgi:hypothetical protein